jgi:FkbM family methyltransferase
MTIRTMLSRIAAMTPLGYIPVRVRTGPAKGAKWTFAPFSHNWRAGGEEDLAAGIAHLKDPKGAVCWDFGAHFGIHTVGMAMQVGPTGEVASFEPDPVAFRRLSYHVRINYLKNVRLFPAAVSAVAEQKKLIISHGLGTAFSHFQYEDEVGDERTKTMDVQTVVPDELVARGEIRAPNLIKIDVQGHGAKALAGSIRAIHQTHPIIIFSNHSSWELEGTRTLLEPLGYQVRSLAGENVDWSWLRNHDTAVLVCGVRA